MEVVHDLPRMFHYWSNATVRPKLEALGGSWPEDWYARRIARQNAELKRHVRIVSLGAGNGDTELRVAQLLVDRGVREFEFECLDLSQAMLHRGAAAADAAGLSAHFHFVRADFNRWRPDGEREVVMANQSLHHVLELESLFDAVSQTIGSEGVFLTGDIIGRNGHLRWPEALAIVREFWRELPAARRFNLQLHRQEDEFLDWDCSGEGFEGIRAQDILPLLVERFGFETFLGFSNVIAPFVDRSFGDHFDPDVASDRDFIDRVHARDDAEMLAGNIKPTQMVAALRNRRDIPTSCWRHLTPQFCVRDPSLP
jgi:SAM-dependent methyltransferase